MRATDWEFENRAWLFGMVFAVAFPLYFVDEKNSTEVFSGWIAAHSEMDSERVARMVFLGAAALCGVAAMLRTWASSYLDARVVYAADIKSDGLVADGPYRYVRNPLYLANVLLVIAMGFMMSRSGFIVAIVLMLAFCYRLIFREEAELRAGQYESYVNYFRLVPRLWPAASPRLPSSGQCADWPAGLTAELWVWGFAGALLVFAATLSAPMFFGVLVASQCVLWLTSRRRHTAGNIKPP